MSFSRVASKVAFSGRVKVGFVAAILRGKKHVWSKMSKIFGNNDQNDLNLATHHVRNLDTTYPFSVKHCCNATGLDPTMAFSKRWQIRTSAGGRLRKHAGKTGQPGKG